MWPMQAVNFPFNADYSMCKAVHSQFDSGRAETCSEAGFTTEFHGNVGDGISTVEFGYSSDYVDMDNASENFFFCV